MKCPWCAQNIDVRFIKAPGDSGSTSSDSPSLKEIMDLIHDDELESDFEIKFMEGFRPRYEQYGDRTHVSEKQMQVLRKIAAK